MGNQTFEHLNSINLKHYSRKPVQPATSAKRPMLSPPKQIPVQSLPSNATSNHFFLLPNEKKTCQKQ